MSGLFSRMMGAAGRVVAAYAIAEREARDRDRQALVDAYNARAALRGRTASPAVAPAPGAPGRAPQATDGAPAPRSGTPGAPAEASKAPNAASGDATPLGALFGDRERMLGAIAMAEILAPPVSLR